MHQSFASVIYTPATQISLTGATIDVRFDVAEPLFWTMFSWAYLDTSSRNMSGAFYIQSIGWALMSSGSLQVALNCGAQPLSNLTSQCQFTGSGWSENIGEVWFANVRYNPSTATLSGSIASFAGNFSVEGIYMPLIKASLQESLVWLRANHNISMSIQNPERYIVKTWNFKIIPSMNPLYTRTVSGGGDWIFTPVDLSLADTYTIEITDPDGWTTKYSGIVVAPAQASQTLDSTAWLFVKDFCDDNPWQCPDGWARIATVLSSDSSPKVADWSDAYNFTLKLRDTYGNRITTGTVEVSYTGTVSAVQLPDKIINSPYGYLAWFKDGIIIDGGIAPLWDATGNWTDTVSPIPTGNIQYSLKSIAPTDGWDNIVVLDKIKYTAPGDPEFTITNPTPLVFTPAYTATITPPTSILIWERNTFEGTLVSHTSEVLSPGVEILFHVWSGTLAYFDDIHSTHGGIESSRDADWFIDLDYPSSLKMSPSIGSYAFSGKYTSIVFPPVPEPVQIHGFITYSTGGLSVVYPSWYSQKLSERETFPVKFLWQEVFSKEQNSAKIRTDAYNKIRKNTALLARNRSPTDTYSDAKYTISSWDITVNNTVFDTKETIITVGGNVTVATNISKRDYPIAIIALTDSNGNGGNILIYEDVTDVSASLFPEHALMSTWSNQLYIYGSLISANTLGTALFWRCPYYVNPCIDPEKYDLATLRSYTGTISWNPASSLTALKYPTISLIVDYDMRLQIDPPSGFPQ